MAEIYIVHTRADRWRARMLAVAQRLYLPRDIPPPRLICHTPVSARFHSELEKNPLSIILILWSRSARETPGFLEWALSRSRTAFVITALFHYTDDAQIPQELRHDVIYDLGSWPIIWNRHIFKSITSRALRNRELLKTRFGVMVDPGEGIDGGDEEADEFCFNSPALAPACPASPIRNRSSPIDIPLTHTKNTRQVASPSWQDALIDQLQTLKPGKLLFNAPEKMKQGTDSLIEVRISQDPLEVLIKGLRSKGTPQIEEIKVASLMSVKLTGEDFKITPKSETDQVIDAFGYTQWTWLVRPLKSGKKSLFLQVTVRLILPSVGTEKKDFPVLEKEIEIQVNLPYQAKRLVSENWLTFLTAIVLPTVGWFAKKYFGE